VQGICAQELATHVQSWGGDSTYAVVPESVGVQLGRPAGVLAVSAIVMTPFDDAGGAGWGSRAHAERTSASTTTDTANTSRTKIPRIDRMRPPWKFGARFPRRRGDT
jgi:hypothetical protein